VIQFFSNYLGTKKRNLFYKLLLKFKVFIIYVIIGSFSIVIELFFRKILILFQFEETFSTFIVLPLGIFIAFYLNLKFNFKIKKDRILISCLIFHLISLASIITQLIIKEKFLVGINYEIKRVFISGLCFIFFYFLHIKFSFKDQIKIGTAIYANGIDDIGKIYDKIEIYPDFIHIDLVDETFLDNANKIEEDQIKKTREKWINKEIHLHIMSKKPSRWIQKYIDYVDKIFFHFEIDENIDQILENHKKDGNKLGLAVHNKTNFILFEKQIEKFKNILLLAIDKPGMSGQLFNEDAYNNIDKINKLIKNKNITLCVDGGVNLQNIKKINSAEIVSGSYVLKSIDPIYAMLRLKFS
jgi:ribulose-phosphate 3-epimerase